jgi:hypothetical protein
VLRAGQTAEGQAKCQGPTCVIRRIFGPSTVGLFAGFAATGANLSLVLQMRIDHEGLEAIEDTMNRNLSPAEPLNIRKRRQVVKLTNARV